MELSAEQITELGLTEENVPKVSSFLADQIANTKQEFEGVANKNAEAILDGALGKIATDTKIARNQGEKAGDYIPRAWGEFNSNRINELNTSKLSYEQKVKDFKGNEDLITKITTLETEKDSLLQKYADYDDVKGKAEKFEPLSNEFNSMKLQVAFSKVKPNFPSDANQYEVDAKWGGLKKDILDKYDIQMVDGEAIAISKENQHSQKKLSDLVGQNEDINALLKGRQQTGTGHQQATLEDIEGVPFKIPKDANAETRTKLIREHLTKEGLAVTDNKYSAEFARLNRAILSKK